MEFKLYYCTHCGNIIFKVVDKGVPVMCCGQKMEELVPNTTDAAQEKHVPVVEKTPHGSGSSVTVKVGSVEHPMLRALHLLYRRGGRRHRHHEVPQARRQARAEDLRAGRQGGGLRDLQPPRLLEGRGLRALT